MIDDYLITCIANDVRTCFIDSHSIWYDNHQTYAMPTATISRPFIVGWHVVGCRIGISHHRSYLNWSESFRYTLGIQAISGKTQVRFILFVRFIIICFQPLLLLLVWLCVLRYLHASCVFSTHLIMLHHHQETFCEVDSLLDTQHRVQDLVKSREVWQP